MANLEIEIELRPDADSETSKEMVLSEVSHGLGLRPEVKVVSGGTLPRFELKAKRFIKQDLNKDRNEKTSQTEGQR